jgi:hypothetical protein
MTDIETIATVKLPAKTFYREGSWGSYSLDGKHESTMTLYRDGRGLYIEWDIPSIDEVEHIGLEVEGKRIVGYDGVQSFPKLAYKWLRSLGYVIARDVI